LATLPRLLATGEKLPRILNIVEFLIDQSQFFAMRMALLNYPRETQLDRSSSMAWESENARIGQY
jgi:hypothetical protein